jgi:hypothetical protein
VSRTSLRRLRPVVLLALAAAVLLPRLAVGTSAAAFTDSASAASNTVTAATCSSTAWNTWLTSTSNIPSSSRDVYNRLSGSNLSSDSWLSSSSWSSSSVTTNQSGALYCDSNTALSISGASGHADTAAATQGTLGLSSSASTTLMVWVKTSSSSAGTIAALGNSGGGSYGDRFVWMDSSGIVNFSARSGNSSSSWSISGGSAVNDGSWHLIVVAMGGYTNGGATLYVDGASVATRSTSGTTYAFRNFSSTSISWTVGDQSGSTQPSGVPTSALAATYDEFVVIDTTNLTSTQIAALYASADL